MVWKKSKQQIIVTTINNHIKRQLLMFPVNSENVSAWWLHFWFSILQAWGYHDGQEAGMICSSTTSSSKICLYRCQPRSPFPRLKQGWVGMKRSDFHCHEAFGKFDIAPEDISMCAGCTHLAHIYNNIKYNNIYIAVCSTCLCRTQCMRLAYADYVVDASWIILV